MHPRTLSLIIPTRQRTASLGRLLDSLAATTARRDAVEILLVVDADDPDSIAFRHDAMQVKHVVVAPGLTMGALNTAGFETSSGDVVMLLNDDVVARTPGWDERVLACFRGLPDGIALVHVNDTLMREHLCTFPIVSRAFCELAGGICPVEYIRYRIDDHIEDLFNLLAALGERRTFYLPDVIFEHLNAVQMPQGHREYHSDPATLALDAPRFDALFRQRKEIALVLLDHIERCRQRASAAMRRRRLERIADPFSLRTPGRQRSAAAPRVRTAPLADTPAELNRLAGAAADYVAFLPAGARAEPLSRHLGPDVGLVIAGRSLLIDRLRCPPFEEMYERHFFVIDLALRLGEMGMRVVELGPSAGPLPDCEEVYERDWQTFASTWIAPRRLCQFGDLENQLLTERRQTLAALRSPTRRIRQEVGWLADVGKRGWACLCNRGLAGLVRAIGHRLHPHRRAS